MALAGERWAAAIRFLRRGSGSAALERYSPVQLISFVRLDPGPSGRNFSATEVRLHQMKDKVFVDRAQRGYVTTLREQFVA